MCLLALFYHAVDDSPLIIGANREELYARAGDPPRVLDGPIQAVAGVDPTAGGTWLGVNARGVAAAVTNRRGGPAPPAPRSRGLLVRDLLGCPSAAAALDLAQRELSGGRYAGCNVVVADRERAVVLHGGEWLRVWPLPVGLHILTNSDLNDSGDPRLSYAAWWLGRRHYSSSADCIAALKELCGLRNGDGPPVCLRGEDRGTVSSTVVALRDDPARSVYLHAQGPPDLTPYDDYSHLLREILADPGEVTAVYPHVIRLRGPWECAPLQRLRRLPDGTAEEVGGDLPPARRMTMPCRWHEGGLTDFTGRVRFTRRFGYPGQIDAWERVWLVFAAVEGIAEVALNGQALGRHDGSGPLAYDITALLRERNHLVLVVEDLTGTGGLWGEVALEIRRTAYLRGVSFDPEVHGETAVLRAAGEVVGTSERPLELYLLLDNRTVAYATVAPTPEGQRFHLTSEELGKERWAAGPHAVRVELVDAATVWYVVERSFDFPPAVPPETSR